MKGWWWRNILVRCVLEKWVWRGARIDRMVWSGNAESKLTVKNTGQRFDSSKMTLEEILKLTYWWCQDLDQTQVKHELGLAESTGVDWDSFCREVCEITLLENGEKLAENGKVVQIDESRFGKRKYHRGHHVEGQWVFGGIEQDSRKWFLVAVEKRDEQTLLPIIQKWIEPGTIIVSDCWKAYSKLETHGYEHRTVNHSREFVNKDGDQRVKNEHWRVKSEKRMVKGEGEG